MKQVVTLGEILVEIMAKNTNQKFTQTGEFLGPYPSGAPAIFINQVAKMKVPAAIIGAVGKDAFGQVCLDRLNQNGVDTQLISVDSERPTGSAFVTYQDDGGRDFIFNIRHSAAAHFQFNESVKQQLTHCAVFHVMGSSIFSHDVIAVLQDAISIVKAHGGKISFDPNVRKELLSDDTLFRFFQDVLQQTDIFLPSGEELFSLTGQTSIDAALASVFEMGVGEVVLKEGGQGCRYFNGKETYREAPHPVHEVDATGAGDTFGATFIASRVLGYSPEKSLQLANLSGALAVTKWGPMEGAATEAELTHFFISLSNSLKEA